MRDVEFWDTYALLHLKVVGKDDKSTLLLTRVAFSIEGVEVEKEDGHLEGWDYRVRVIAKARLGPTERVGM